MRQLASVILNYPYRLRSIFSIFLVIMIPSLPLLAQVNFVPNPGFEDVSDCDLEYGEANKAMPWKIVNLPVATPDLFHSCANNDFFITPTSGCNDLIYPKSGEGMVGLVSNSAFAEERIYARLIDELPQGIDIYVAYSIRPREKCGGPMDFLCYSNSLSLVFSDFQFQSQQVVLASDTIVDGTEDWITMEACFAANGTEDFVLLGNYKETTQTLVYCDFINATANFAYTYVDEVIVSPFDVVPDTLYLCAGEVLELDATFYDVPISWSDGWQGGVRTIEQGGNYIVRGSLTDCFLTDRTVVIEIPADTAEIELDICAGETLMLESPFAGAWENGDTNRIRTITQAGIYKLSLLTPCGERSREYTIEATSCDIRYFVPNAFSPNRDGINDQLQFFFDADFDFSGELNVFDRWGNQLFNAKNVTALSPVTWDGSFRNKDLGAGIVVWTYEYISARDGLTRKIAGDVMIVK
jgi:gliding motility-associated-like protein